MTSRMPSERVISGGQTGADRAALDAALSAGFPCGGFCPAGRQAEDGPINARYPLTEIAGGYRQRTRRNVETSDGTVIFYHLRISGGTELTLQFCMKLKKPCKLIDMDLATPDRAAAVLAAFIESEDVRVLNVAGPRASSHPDIHAFVYSTLNSLLRNTG